MNWTTDKPTEAGWTHEAPSKEGWYWMRAPKHGWRDCVMWVEKDEDGFYIDVGDCDTEYVTDIDAEWLGPITPDSFQQGRVAGLVKAVEIIKANTDVKKAIEIIRLHSLAQQAQEGGVGDVHG